MKKIIAMLLAVVLCLGLFAGCTGGNNQPTNGNTTPSASLADAKEYLYAMYRDNDGTVTSRDYTRVGAVMIDGVSFAVTWTTDAPDYVTIAAGENNMVNFDIVEEPDEDVAYTITATIADAEGKTETVVFTHSILAPKKSGVEFVKEPEIGKSYKYAMVQAELGQTLYLTGEMDGYYLATTTNPFNAVDVTVEAADGGVYLTFVKEDVKTYINIIPRADNPSKVNAVFGTEPTCVWSWDAERKTYTTKVGETTWYIGTYGSYKTFSPSDVSYIEDVSKIGVSQFPAGLCNVNIVAEQVAEPVAGTAYKYALVQASRGETLYLTGEMDGYYLATTVNPGEAVNVFVETTDGGMHIYFMKDEVKTYINIIPRADNPSKVNAVFGTEPTCVWVWDSVRKTYTTKVGETTWYIGTYNTYNTMSPSDVSYIEDVSKIGVSQFPSGMYIVDGFMG